jgi:citrate lyase subunit beta/citryl-CoA lyase
VTEQVDDRRVPRVRSALFVPTSQRRFLDGVDRRHADAVILDLEDSVTPDGRDEARGNVAAWLAGRTRDGGPALFARINQIETGQLEDDLAAVVQPALCGVVLPKVSSPNDIARLSSALAWHEGRIGLPLGSIRIWPLIETAAAVSHVFDIARADPRIAYMGGATAPNGDLARELGFEVTRSGVETIVLRSQVLIAARAAGVPNPITGMYTDIDDLAGFEDFARQSRTLGYDGIMVIHPSHVEIANAVFAPDAEAVAEAHAVIEALEAARRNGDGAVRHAGRMIDTAMEDTARRVIAEHQSLRSRQDEPVVDTQERS